MYFPCRHARCQEERERDRERYGEWSKDPLRLQEVGAKGQGRNADRNAGKISALHLKF